MAKTERKRLRIPPYRKHYSYYNTGIALILSLFFLLVGDGRGGLLLSEAATTVSGAAQTVFKGISDFFSDTINSIQTLANLQEEYDELRVQLEESKQFERDYMALEREVDLLREQLELSQGLGYERIASQLIGYDPQTFGSHLLIDKGSSSGVHRGDPVVALHQGRVGLVGHVVSVGIGNSQVMPLYDLQSNVSARLSQSRVMGLVSGGGIQGQSIRLVLNFISKNDLSSVAIGETVVTSGLSRRYPAGLRIGTVQAITAESGEQHFTIDLEPSLDFSSLEYLYVLKLGDQR